MQKNLILIYLFLTLGIMFSLAIPVTYSVYRNKSDTGGSITAADWDVSITPDNNHSLQVVSNGTNTISYTLDVTNDSKVDVTYSIIVSDIPNGVVVKLDDGSFQIPSSGSVTLSSANTAINYNDLLHTKGHTITFKANSGATAVSNHEMTIDVKFQQVL